jgi:hypothetical protein
LLLEFAASNVDQKQVLPTLIDKSDTIESIEKSINHSRLGQGFPVLGLLIEWTNRCTKDQPLAIGGPRRMSGTMRHKGKLMSFASIGWQEPHLSLPFALLLFIIWPINRRWAR